MPVIKKFWYNPFSGIYRFSFELKSFPINKFNFKILFFSLFNLLLFILVSFNFLLFILFNKFKINLLNKKLEKIKLEKIYVKIKIILIYFQSKGFSVQISKG